jgi:energy-coupling factor transporter transmembrane protein EcfT
MLVGIFRSNYTPFSSLMHNLSAYSLALVFGLFMVGSRWMVPGFPKEFFAASWILVSMLVGVGISAGLGRMNTVGLEMAGFALGMAWLFLFVGNTEDNAVQLEPDSFPD